jgi:hypothetical protein
MLETLKDERIAEDIEGGCQKNFAFYPSHSGSKEEDF